MNHLEEITITTETETFIVRLEQIHANKYICREIVGGEPKPHLFWLPKATEGIPTADTARAEIEQEFRRIRRI